MRFAVSPRHCGMCEVYKVHDWGERVRRQTLKWIVHNGRTASEINTVKRRCTPHKLLVLSLRINTPAAGVLLLYSSAVSLTEDAALWNTIPHKNSPAFARSPKRWFSALGLTQELTSDAELLRWWAFRSIIWVKLRSCTGLRVTTAF